MHPDYRQERGVHAHWHHAGGIICRQYSCRRVEQHIAVPIVTTVQHSSDCTAEYRLSPCTQQLEVASESGTGDLDKRPSGNWLCILQGALQCEKSLFSMPCSATMACSSHEYDSSNPLLAWNCILLPMYDRVSGA